MNALPMNALPIVAAETRRLTRVALLVAIALPTMTALGVLAGGALLLARGRWLALPALLPFVVWAAAAALALWVARRSRRLLAQATPARVASEIEREQGLRRGSLTGLLEVSATGGIFARVAAAALGERLAGVATLPAPGHRARSTRALLVSTLALAQVGVLVALGAAHRGDGWRALLRPVAAWRGELLAPLAIDVAPEKVLRGSPAVLGVNAVGRTRLDVRWRAVGGAWRDSTIPVTDAGRATFIVVRAESDLHLVVSDGRTATDTARIAVVDRPFLGEVEIRATFPAYFARAPERLAADELVRVPAGTHLAISARASESMLHAALRNDRGARSMRVDGVRASLGWTPVQSGEWTWEVAGETQPIEDLPPLLRIEVVPDALPRPEILAPVGELFLGLDEGVTLELQAEDDNALRRVWLRRWIARADGRAESVSESTLVARGAGRPDAAWRGTADVAIARLGLRPGDALIVELAASDLAPGQRVARSRPLRLRLPTAEEAREVARANADAVVDAADAAVRAQRDLTARTETEARTRSDRSTPAEQTESGRDSAAAGTLRYESAARAREIAGAQRALEERVRALEESAREMRDRLARAGVLDPALAQQLEDAQRLLREAMTPELIAALERLETASQGLDADRTRQSLAELAAQQARMREALEKSAELLRRAALEATMQTLADRGEELAAAQRALADSGRSDSRTAEELARAASLARASRDLTSSAAALAERLNAADARLGATAAGEGAAEARRSAEALTEVARDSAALGRAANAMERSADALSRARAQQVAEWRSALTDALDRAVQELLQLARSQDAIADRVRTDTARTALRSEQSAVQQGALAAQQRLDEQARRSALVTPRSQAQVERARQRVAQATREGAEAARGQTENTMREAAVALRQAAAQVTRDRERVAAARSASGLPEMIEQMQQLAQQQGGLNSQLLSLLSLLPGARSGGASQGLDAEGQRAARELARAQREVARQLDAVADADPSGRATELAREARALAAALDQGAVDPATQARQERLLRRMLDAGRSLEQEEREESGRREARSARTAATFTPGADAADRTPPFAVPTWEELRGLSAEDRRLVIEYFRRLNAEVRP